MTKEEIISKVLDKLKNRPDLINIKQPYLNDVVEDALNDTLTFINAREGDEIVEGLMTPIKDLCVIRLNLTGTEGLTSSGKAGTSESYLEDIPKHIKRTLKKFRRLP